MFLVSRIRWYYRDRQESSSAREWVSLAIRSMDEAELHFRTGCWFSDVFTNDMSSSDYVASLTWLALQPVRIRNEAASLLSSISELVIERERFLLYHRLEISEVDTIPIQRNVIVGTYDRRGFHRSSDLAMSTEEAICHAGNV